MAIFFVKKIKYVSKGGKGGGGVEIRFSRVKNDGGKKC